MSNPNKKPRLGYLVSAYPAISHTFILREIEHLRTLGYSISTASINPPDRAVEAMESLERQEAKNTFVIKTDGVIGALKACTWSFARQPFKTLRMLQSSWRMRSATNPWKGLAYAVEALMVVRWMQRQGVRHLHVHFGNVGATIGVLVKRVNGCHLSLTIHGPDEFDDVPGQHLALKMREADAVICISQFARSQLMRISDSAHWSKMRVCRLGVDSGQFPFSLRQSKSIVRMLCVGRLTPAKCQVLLVQACAALRDAGKQFHLTMVGAGPDHERIAVEVRKRELQSHISMTGALNQLAVRQAFSEADVFVLPSLAEGIPVVLMEAMCSGVPCVSTPVNGIPELIEHGVTGLLATPGDLDSLIAQLERILADTDFRIALAQAAHQKVTSMFDFKTNVTELGQIFQSFPNKV